MEQMDADYYFRQSALTTALPEWSRGREFITYKVQGDGVAVIKC